MQPTLAVGGDLHFVGVHRAARLGDAAVRALGGDDESAGAIEPATCPLAPTPTGGDEGAEVAGGAAADEHATGRRRHAGQIGEVAQRLVLREDGSSTFHPRAGIDVGGAHHEVEQDGRLRGRCRHERQETRMVGRDAGGGEHLAEHAQRFQAAQAAFGDRAPRHRLQLGRCAGRIQRRLHAHPIDGVANDGLREHLHGGIVLVHGSQSASCPARVTPAPLQAARGRGRSLWRLRRSQATERLSSWCRAARCPRCVVHHRG